ncbi:MAG: EamA family transporter, partial [Verrucomicrobiia bacterium]
RSVVAWLYLTFFGSLIGFSAYVWLLKATTMARASTYAYVNPVVALCLGWALAGEQITTRSLFAATAIILAVVIIVTQSAEAPSEV